VHLEVSTVSNVVSVLFTLLLIMVIANKNLNYF